MRALFASALLAACGFQPSTALSTSDGGPDSAVIDARAIDGVPHDSTLPANCYGTGFTVVCPAVLPTLPLVVTSTRVVTTESGSPDCIELMPTNDAVCAIAGTTVNISSFLSAKGARPLVVLSLGTLDVPGEIDVFSAKDAPGAGSTGAGCTGTAPTLAGGGGFGGSFGSKGGNGGATAPPGGVAGNAIVPTLLRGGCPGGPGLNSSGFVGLGGGAVALIAVGAISVLGTVDASGSFGSGATNAHDGGNGGGAGGMILLDGTSVTVGVTTQIFANGGGGGGGGSSGNTAGGDGNDPTSTTANGHGGNGGGTGGSSGGDGGDGATLNTMTRDPVDAQAGDDGSNATAGFGGGGGGFGVIKIFRAPAPNDPTRFSPRPS